MSSRVTAVGVVCLAMAALPFAGTARAQTTTETEVVAVADEANSAEAIAELPRPGFWEGGGVRVTEGTVLHPSFAVAGAYQTNVFYQDPDDGPNGPISAGVARFTVGATYQTLSPGRLELEAPGGGGSRPRLAFSIESLLTWNQFLSGESAVTENNDLGIGLNAEFNLNPQGRLSLDLRDSFVRNVNPGQSLREDLDRDRNELTARGTFRPGGGAIELYLQYGFIIDVFESDVLLFQDRYTHTGTLGAKWQWLPKTQINFDASLGTVSPSNEDVKSPSTPLRIWAGVSSLFTPSFGIVARGGFGKGFYERGEDVTTYLALLELRFALGPTIRTAVGYSHDFADALVGNFYTDHRIFARGGWQLADRWQLRLLAELRIRSYGGITDTDRLDLCGDASCGNFRDDLLTRVEASVEYQVTPWLFASLAYTLDTDSTDFFVRGGGADDFGAYVANELTARLAARF